MAEPIEARCRRCHRDFYLFELLERRDGECPRCRHPLSADWTFLLIEETDRAERAQREFLRALRRLVGLPGNLEIKPRSILRNVLDEVGWEEELADEPEIIFEQVRHLEDKAKEWRQLTEQQKQEQAPYIVDLVRHLATRLLRDEATGLDVIGEAADPEGPSGKERASR
jgi:RNA polymerase subunit RPABC4/transcription elongation factor Spt4